MEIRQYANKYFSELSENTMKNNKILQIFQKSFYRLPEWQIYVYTPSRFTPPQALILTLYNINIDC